MTRSSRKPSTLSDSLHQRLNSYALAASAAGVSFLALAQPCDAKIVYTKVNCLLGGGAGNTCTIDLTQNGVSEFQVSYSKRKGVSSLRVHRYNPASGADRIVPAPGTYTACNPFSAAALRQGENIGRRFFPCRSPSTNLMFKHGDTSDGRSVSGGQWKDVRDRYLGLQFSIGSGIHYGWARLRVGLKASGEIEAVLTGYAYETIPNKPIIAGKTKGPEVITIEPASLGTLAAGKSRLQSTTK